MFHVDEDVFESVAQLTEMWRKLVSEVGGQVQDEKSLAVRWADTDFGFYNAIIANDRVHGTAQLREIFSESAQFMDRKSRPGFLWIFEELVSPDVRAGMIALAAESGLALSLKCWGMAGELTSMEAPTHPSLRFERVSRADHLDMYATLNAAAYGFPEASVQEVFNGSQLWCDEIFAYIAYEGTQPVACAGACEIDGRLFVVLVATEPLKQQRGFGEAVTRKALFEASRATGLTRGCLQATVAGRPVYQKIGFRENSTLQLFSRSTI